MAKQKKAAPGPAVAPGKVSGKAKTAGNTPDVEIISKRACEHCGQLIPSKKILVIQRISYPDNSQRSHRINHYYHHDHYKMGSSA